MRRFFVAEQLTQFTSDAWNRAKGLLEQATVLET
jgi:hypothetical protein